MFCHCFLGELTCLLPLLSLLPGQELRPDTQDHLIHSSWRRENEDHHYPFILGASYETYISFPLPEGVKMRSTFTLSFLGQVIKPTSPSLFLKAWKWGALLPVHSGGQVMKPTSYPFILGTSYETWCRHPPTPTSRQSMYLDVFNIGVFHDIFTSSFLPSS